MSLAKEHEDLLQVLDDERSQRAKDVQKMSEQVKGERQLLEEKLMQVEAAKIDAQV